MLIIHNLLNLKKNLNPTFCFYKSGVVIYSLRLFSKKLFVLKSLANFILTKNE